MFGSADGMRGATDFFSLRRVVFIWGCIRPQLGGERPALTRLPKEYPLGNSSNETSMFGMGGAKPSAATSPIGLAALGREGGFLK